MVRFLFLLAVFASPAVSAQVPRYALEPGLELRFAVKSCTWFDSEDGTNEMPRESDGSPAYRKSSLVIYVLNRNTDKSCRVLMTSTSEDDRLLLTWADLFDDGRLNLIPSAMPLLELDSLRTVFPRLPLDEHEFKSGWIEVEPRTGVQMRYSGTGQEITAEMESPVGSVASGRFSLRYRLDASTGLPVEIVSQGRWEQYKENFSCTVSWEETIRHDASWVNDFSANAAAFFEARFRYQQSSRLSLVDRAIAERQYPGAVGAMLDKTIADLQGTRESLTEPLFQRELDVIIQQARENYDNRIEQARSWSKLAGLPVPAWTADDLNQVGHRLEDYRGRVVVLDFWFRQCSFCIRAMPQIEKTEADFREFGAPVSFFGISIDEEVDDAKFVADTMQLDYPVLHSPAIAELFGVQAYPTVLVIGPDGTLQGIFSGYSLTLQDDLAACIRRILDSAGDSD